MQKRKIAILRGGPSSEYDVSMKTGRSIINSLSDDYQIIDVVIDKNGNWFVSGLQKTPQEVARYCDLIFNALHGEYGEDGKVQQILEKLSVPFTGPRALGAALSMNKGCAKEIYRQLGLKTPHSMIISKDDIDDDFLLNLFKTFPMPIIVKPISKGSSVGVFIARTFNDLYESIKKGFQYSDKLLLEEFIEGKEATVGVLDNFRNQKNYALLPIEIIPPKDRGFFDNVCKYDGSSNYVCPGRFNISHSKEMQDFAKKVHEALNLRHYSRSDFIVHPKRGIYILETNSLPGLTEDSLFPKSLESIGLTYKEMLRHIIDLALDGK